MAVKRIDTRDDRYSPWRAQNALRTTVGEKPANGPHPELPYVAGLLSILLLSAAIMALGAVTVVSPVGVLDWVIPVLTTGLSSLIAPTLAMVVTYAVRVRVPNWSRDRNSPKAANLTI